MQKIIFFLSVILALGYLSDSLKCFALIFSFRYPLLFFDRFTTPPLLFASLIFLAYRLSDEITLQIRRKSFEEASTQFLHDVRSPMAALQVASELDTESSAETRELIAIAVSRIKSISNTLYNYGQDPQTSIKPLKPCFEKVYKEVQILLSKSQIAIETHFDEGERPLVAKINPNEFARVLSNLVNNAIEAIGLDGEIRISLGTADQHPFVKIEDNGKGMSPQLLAILGGRGITSGKASGSGLGIYHARKTIEGWGGKLKIASEENVGTCVHIIF